ncbi:unnamed protein product [Adineta steineri]|uniref:Uncharacterized protein n=1 Tax=Adineta steineri TaxID=433720 RepID=A0A815N546_9BILA|nr:unnamed protein product [Adineta steineri]CAF3561121.1 unnamed protein product [Adineta steineri]
MLFTRSPPFSSPSVSSSVESESSPAHTAFISNSRHVENHQHTGYSLTNTTFTTNGPSNNTLLSTSESHYSQLSDQDSFYSLFSTSSSSSPSIPLTPIKTITH